MNFDISDFWNRVKELIKKNNITQRSLSSNIGLTPRTVETWINQKTIPNAYQTYLLSKELGCSMEYLVTGVSEQPALPSDLQEVINKYATKA